jgi:D-aminopeptidase
MRINFRSFFRILLFSFILIFIISFSGAFILQAQTQGKTDPAQKKPLKVFVSVDMEGIWGGVHGNQCSSDSPEYQLARKWMVEDVNAVMLKAPDNFEIDFHNSNQAELGLLIPGVKRTSPRTLTFTTQDYLEGFKLRRALIALASVS